MKEKLSKKTRFYFAVEISFGVLTVVFSRMDYMRHHWEMG